jgi:putative membrane protein
MDNHWIVSALIHWIVSAVALLLTAFLVPGFRIKNFSSALVAAIFIGIVNAVIGPFLLFITLPINLLTLGLFTFVVNGIVLKICAGLLKDFEISSWASAIFGAFILALVRTLLSMVLPNGRF